MADETPREKTSEQKPSQTEEAPQGAPCSFLDGDFLLALFLALIIDILNWVLEIGVIANFAVGWAFILWARFKGAPQPTAPQKQGGANAGAGQIQNVKNKLVRKALMRWGGQFIPFWNNTFGWTRFVLDMLKRPKPAPNTERAPVPTAEQNATITQTA